MIYYAFNNNKPLPTAKAKFFITHYCQHCNTESIGEWLQYKNEAISFAQLKRCPICGEEFANNLEHHFCSDSNIFQQCKGLKKLDDRFFPVSREMAFCRKDFPDGFTDDLELGQEILTKYGPGTVTKNQSGMDIIMVEFFNKYNATDKILSSLRFARNTYYNQLAHKKFKSFIDNCVIESESVSINGISIKENFNTKEYLEQLVTIEKNIFSLSERLKDLYLENLTAEKDAFASRKLETSSNTKALEKALELCEALKRKNVVNKIKITDFPITYPNEPKKPKMPKEPVLAQPGFFNKKRILAENAVLTEKYEKELESYNLALEKYESDLKNYNEAKKLLERQRYESYKSAVENAKNNLAKEIETAKAKYEELLTKQQEAEKSASDIPTPEKAKHQFFKEEIEIAEDLLKKFYKARNDMYSCGVIFEKYRNFVAVSSFYEYISSGRSETLEGANGAYNIYENETRMNMVIGQLNQVIESLEEIKQNQYMIYSAIQETNEHLQTLKTSTSQMLGALNEINEKATSMESYMSKISYNTKVTAYNTEKTAFYAKKNAELTNALGFLVALK